MQDCLSVQSSFCPIRETVDKNGFRVPWEVESYAQDFEKAQVRGGFFDLSHWSTVSLRGPDSRDYLNRMTTVDFKIFSPDKVRRTALFSRERASLGIALGMFLQAREEGFRLCNPAAGARHPGVRSLSEKFHFQENLTVSDSSQRNRSVPDYGIPATMSVLISDLKRRRPPCALCKLAGNTAWLSSGAMSCGTRWLWLCIWRVQAPAFFGGDAKTLARAASWRTPFRVS